jgi:hypothetical protein
MLAIKAALTIGTVSDEGTTKGKGEAPCPSVFPDSADAMEIGFSAWKQNE